MHITFLKDMGNNYFVDAVIISKISTEKEIQEAIDKMKEKCLENYNYKNLIDFLPRDCKVYDILSNGIVYY